MNWNEVMLKRLCLALMVLFLCTSSQAQGTNIYGMMSPKLKQFLVAHPGASKSLSDALSEAFTNRTVELYYFYSSDESTPRALHYYLNDSSVVIGIRENQEPSDQCFCLIFEIFNSEGERRFNQLMEDAQSGKVSKTDFAREMTLQEFQAAKRMKKMLPDFRLNKTEIARCNYYQTVSKCPETFPAFLDYSTRTVKYFEHEYDALRESKQQPNTTLEPTAAASLVSTNK